jgi:regulator of RNase E activity RraA
MKTLANSLKRLVGASGFEPPTSWSRTRRVTFCKAFAFNISIENGSYGQDSAPRYKVVDFRVPVEIGAVRVRPGDILVGDIDGVLVVPTEAEEELVTRALEKVRGEKLVRKAIEAGSGAVEAFAKDGIM